MSASLVGSEMCIRDRLCMGPDRAIDVAVTDIKGALGVLECDVPRGKERGAPRTLVVERAGRNELDGAMCLAPVGTTCCMCGECQTA
eukprot:13775309-Alexandrium_andersonii.AAC.1